MTAPTPTPAEIARRLSPAQAAALLGDYTDATAQQLADEGLAVMKGGYWFTTSLGADVRAELERMQMEARDG